MWLVSVCIIAAFQAPVSRNELGEKVMPPAEFTSGFVRCVNALFFHTFIPRGEMLINELQAPGTLLV